MDTENEVLQLYQTHKLSVREIAEQSGVSYSTVNRWIAKAGLASPRQRGVRDIDSKLCWNIYGCDIPALRAIQGGLKLSDKASPALLYYSQRKRYRITPGWELTFPQWWEVWQGHWKRRKRFNLVFAPIDPAQPITPNNCKVITRSRYQKQNK